MDPGLADILVTNLLKNAIVHNREGGSIAVETGPDRLIIRNDGAPLPFAEEDLFRRFIRDHGKGKGLGLGLSLVKKICESYGFLLEYAYKKEQHVFTLVYSF